MPGSAGLRFALDRPVRDMVFFAALISRHGYGSFSDVAANRVDP